MTVAEQATTRLARMGISSRYAVTVYIITQMKKKKKMTKDEMKNRISMALKDPILQQGFEIFCKENAEAKERIKTLEYRCENIKDTDTMELVALQRENAELKEKFTKAKEIIKSLMLFAEIDCREYEEAYKKAEQFLKEE